MAIPTEIKSLTNKRNNEEKSSIEESIKKLEILRGKHEIAVGLSGGVDSSLTASLLLKAGWKVEGITLWLMKGQGSCCSDGLIDAAAICEELGITHHVIDSRETFQKEIVEQIINDYKEGITPLPCSKCNRSVKFSEMLKWAEEKCNIHRIATGHYARIQYSSETFELHAVPGNSKKRHKLLRGRDKH